MKEEVMNWELHIEVQCLPSRTPTDKPVGKRAAGKQPQATYTLRVAIFQRNFICKHSVVSPASQLLYRASQLESCITITLGTLETPGSQATPRPIKLGS